MSAFNMSSGGWGLPNISATSFYDPPPHPCLPRDPPRLAGSIRELKLPGPREKAISYYLKGRDVGDNESFHSS